MSDVWNFSSHFEPEEGQAGDASTAPGAISEGAERSGSGDQSIRPPVTPDALISMGGDKHDSVRYCSAGFDSLDMLAPTEFAEDDWPDIQAALNLGKERARQSGTQLSANGDFFILPSGTKNYTWHLQYPDFHLFLQDCRFPKSQASNVKFSFNAKYLWSHSDDEIEAKMHEVIQSFGGKILGTKVSRVDPAADFRVFQKFDLHELLRTRVCKSRKVRIYQESNDLENLMVGNKSSPIQCRIYDKAKEVLLKSEKLWFFDLWGLQPESTQVWRVEFQLRRQILRENNINTLRDLRQRWPDLWAYLTKVWLTFRLEDNDNISRRSIAPWWLEVQKAVEDGDERRIVRGTKLQLPEVRRLMAQIRGYLVGVAVRRRIVDPLELISFTYDYLRLFFEGPEFMRQYRVRSIKLGIDPQQKLDGEGRAA